MKYCNYNKVRKTDISNGPGIRVSVFMQGCSFHCKNCFNSETWDFNKGKELTDEIIEKIIQLGDREEIVGLSILGGEPMHPDNVKGTLQLIRKWKESYPKKSIWVWTGFLYENLDKSYLNDIDILVDGQFVEELYSPLLKYRGSSNQRVIDIKQTMKFGIITEISEI